MKTIYNSVKAAIRLAVLLVAFFCSFSTQAQIISPASLTSGLNFDNPQRISSTDLVVGSAYRYYNIVTGVDAVVTIDSLVNGAKVNKIDDNSNGTGYKSAFQPAVQNGGMEGMSYAVFTISFLDNSTSNPVVLPVVSATPLDLDGNNNLKEFAQIRMGTGLSTNYLMSTPDIFVEAFSNTEAMGRNILGIERNGIDTASLANMFTVTNTNISSFSIKYGAITTNNNSAVRQYSLYLKRFDYPGVTLPVQLLSFNAFLNNNKKVDLSWKTANEQNVSHFIVQRSIDGVSFNDAGMVFAAGNSTSDISYKLSDNVANISVPVIYYRLRSIDNDGKSQLSETRIIRLTKQAANEIVVLTYPNPVTNELRITLPVAWQNKPVLFEIFSLNGQLVSKIFSSAASQTEIKNIGALQAGMYNLRVSCNEQTATQKIIKQ